MSILAKRDGRGEQRGRDLRYQLARIRKARRHRRAVDLNHRTGAEPGTEQIQREGRVIRNRMGPCSCPSADLATSPAIALTVTEWREKSGKAAWEWYFARST